MKIFNDPYTYPITLKIDIEIPIGITNKHCEFEQNQISSFPIANV